jgi:hypothetical protein
MRKLLLLLGGACYPFRKDLALPAFPKAHAAFKDAMTGGAAQIVAPHDCLDLFDDNGAWANQQQQIANWLAVKRGEADRPEALLLYYIGHGGIAKGGDQVYLTINASTALDPYFSSIPRESLATLLRSAANDYRKYLIIDCCFAAAVVKLMQSPIADKMTLELRRVGKAVRKPNSGGLAALCASSSLAAASADGRDGLTQFTDALLSALRAGDPDSSDDLSFETVRALLEHQLEERYGVDAVAPSSYFADDFHQPIHRLPLFPNRAERAASPGPPIRPANAGQRRLPSKRKPRAPLIDGSGDLKHCTADDLHYFPPDYPSVDCPLGDGGRLVLQTL